MSNKITFSTVEAFASFCALATEKGLAFWAFEDAVRGTFTVNITGY